MSQQQLTSVDKQSRGAEREPRLREVAGYQLEEMIGTGGFGEVWRATGPGGLPKAVKILFGHHDGPKADAELKSLERMRELRHPFLLNIERIQLWEGQLIVVTELADRCLESRFADARRDGRRGIPRDELLGYLRDAADALDFMSLQHNLQHLDIKPANLLLQGGHAKVGDFGLAKSIQSKDMSMVGGFTPLYAPPEIFEHRATHTSDQYSLAILYQQVLTGVPPFDGRTPAQLAAQHLKRRPDLTALPPTDRPVLDRALSKNPQQRFPDCRTFIDELAKRGQAGTQLPTPRRSESAPPKQVGRTHMLNGGNDSHSAQLESESPTPLPPLPVPSNVTQTPTVCIAVGGLGGKVLAQLELRMATLIGNNSLDAIPLLYIDSDLQAIQAFERQTAVIGSGFHHTLLVPLRSAKAYRDQSKSHSEWLSRRWLYNLPKSGNVEGLRPLGRLAVVDQANRLDQKLRELVRYATTDEAISAASEATSRPFAEGPIKVILVASTSGGTGSGAAVDVAEAAQRVCSELDVAIQDISAFLIHGTSTLRQNADIQKASTLAFLTELDFLNRQSALRDDDRSQAGPFDHSYFLHFGDSLHDADFDREVQSVASYIYAETFTPASCQIQQWRSAGASDSKALRTFGTRVIPAALYQRFHVDSKQLVSAAAERWLMQAHDSDFASGPRSTANADETLQLLESVSLTGMSASAKLATAFQGDFNGLIATVSRDLSHQFEHVENADSADWFPLLAARFETAGHVAGEGGDAVAHAMSHSLQTLQLSSDLAATQLRQHLVGYLDRPGRFRSARQALEVVEFNVAEACRQCVTLKGDLDRKIEQLTAAADQAQLPLQVRIRELCILFSCKAVCGHLLNYVMDVDSQMTAIKDEISEIAVLMQTQLTEPAEASAVSTPSLELLAQFEEFLLTQSEVRLMDVGDAERRPIVLSQLVGLATEFLLTRSVNPESLDVNELSRFPANAQPHLQGVGGGRRVLGIASPQMSTVTWSKSLEDLFGECVTLADDDTPNLTVICETEGIAIDRVARQITHMQPRVVEMASRIHTRRDIDWPSL